MCYSAQIVADYRKFVKAFGARLSLREFADLYFERANGSKAKIPKAMDAAFADPPDRGTARDPGRNRPVQRRAGDRARAGVIQAADPTR